ncbi:DUF3296 domain-containing protein [Burkholderia mayonis]|uniref:DUF3296 domain-containing protein n=1 Tax=Burkholderia mayonis TaxID=1385591 RepID=UPI00131F097D|nr:DUF3296 domain-containing protein [Burkholderia mayonis]
MAAKEDWFQAGRIKDLVDDSRDVNRSANSVWGDHGSEILLGRNLGALVFAVRFMDGVIRTKDVAFKIQARKGRKVAVASSPLARGFDLLGAMVRVYSRGFHFSPQLRLLFDCFATHEIRRCLRRNRNLPFDKDRIEAEVFEEFIAFLREEGARIGIVSQMNDWENASNGNEKSVLNYIGALFSRNSSIVPVEMQLFYKKSCVDELRLHEVAEMVAKEEADDMACLYRREDTVDALPEALRQHDVTEVIGDRDRLFRNMRSKRSIFGNMVGYVWRLDCSYTGYYLRVVFLFDGSLAAAGGALGEHIGQYWVDGITDGRGQFRNMSSTSRKFSGDADLISKINHDDAEKREALTRFLCRLARRDRYVCVQPLSGFKRFGTGRAQMVAPAVPQGKARTKTLKKSE